MLDIKRIREDYEGIKAAVESRGQGSYGIEKVLDIDSRRRQLLADVEAKKNKQNLDSKEIPKLKKEGKDASALMAEMKSLSEEIKELDAQVAVLEDELKTALLNIPNTPNPEVPLGKSDADNLEMRRWGEPTEFAFEPKAHWDIGTDLDILDFERAAKIAGARFTVYKGLGARLERAIMNFMLDLHTEKQGYTEILPPFMVNRDAMYGTGQLPKFEEDMYRCDKDDDLFLIPTAEVPLTNLYSNEVIPADQLPKRICAYSACFRREAGSYGKDTRGLLRLHQFNKVEMVYFSRPDNSYKMHEELTRFGESLLEKLELPYHRLCLCKGDLGFGAAKCYDLEVYAPVEQKWLEVSSCSNFEDFQARRAGIKTKIDGKNVFVHTLNGSGLATPRVMVGICDNYQQKDGSLLIPKVLRPYMGGLEVIEPKK